MTRTTRTALLTMLGAALCIAGFRPSEPVVLTPSTFASALSSLSAGQTYILADGTYPAGLKDKRAGTSTAPITLRAEHPGMAIFDGGSTDGFTLYAANWTVLDGLTFTHAGRAGLYVSASAHVTVQNCQALDNTVWGGLTGHANDITVLSSTFAGSKQQHGLYISGHARNAHVIGCTFANNAKAGLEFNGLDGTGIPSSGYVVDSCTFCGNGKLLAAAAINNLTTPETEIRNCTITGNKAGGIAVYNSNLVTITGCTIKFNPNEGWHCIGAALNPNPGMTSFTYSNCLLQMGKAGPGTHWELDIHKGCIANDQGGNVVLAPATVVQAGAGS